MVAFLVILFLLLASGAPTTAAVCPAGTARVVNGDTLAVAGNRVRLKGVAAPELRQARRRGGASLRGRAGRGPTVVCDLTGERSHGHRVGWCHRDGRKVAEALIKAGLARDCPRYSQGRYAAAEPEASRRLPFPSYCRPR